MHPLRRKRTVYDLLAGIHETVHVLFEPTLVQMVDRTGEHGADTEETIIPQPPCPFDRLGFKVRRVERPVPKTLFLCDVTHFFRNVGACGLRERRLPQVEPRLPPDEKERGGRKNVSAGADVIGRLRDAEKRLVRADIVRRVAHNVWVERNTVIVHEPDDLGFTRSQHLVHPKTMTHLDFVAPEWDLEVRENGVLRFFDARVGVRPRKRMNFSAHAIPFDSFRDNVG